METVKSPQRGGTLDPTIANVFVEEAPLVQPFTWFANTNYVSAKSVQERSVFTNFAVHRDDSEESH
ncbi:hypothetical protein SH449x_001981 [Pirellulaceae bacterium SH449]